MLFVETVVSLNICLFETAYSKKMFLSFYYEDFEKVCRRRLYQFPS